MDGYYLVYVFARRIPLFLVLVGGIVFALARWNRHPRVSFLAITGLGLYLLESTLFTILMQTLPYFFSRGRSTGPGEAFYSVLYVLDDIVYAIVIVLLVAAALSQRYLQQPHSENMNT